MELAARYLTFNTVEVGSNGVYACWVTDKDDAVGQLFGTEMQMKTRTVLVDNQFGFWKKLFHNARFWLKRAMPLFEKTNLLIFLQ